MAEKKGRRRQRDVFGNTLAECGTKNRNIVALNADLSGSTRTSYFARVAECADRFWNMGVAEANMMGVAAGLATTGKIVVASTFAVFATGRAYDQIRQSIAYPNLNVKIISSHAGVTVGGDGASHQCVEDIGLMRMLPNMRVVVPCDGSETEAITESILNIPGPFYMRMGRSEVPDILEPGTPWHLGKAKTLEDGVDVTLIATGIMVGEALRARQALAEDNISARVINMSSIKPIDKDAIIKAAKNTGAIVTAEEHTIIGGLGSAVCEVVAEEYRVPVKRVGVRDVFGQSGEVDELMHAYGLTADNMVKTAKDVMKHRI
jgi:transketolase